MASSSRLGLVRCEHCNRQFNPHSAARHIPWCGNKQQSETRKPRLTSEKQQALDRYRWRISYRPTNYLGRNNHQNSSNNSSNNSNSNSNSNRQDSATTKNKHTSTSSGHFFNHPHNGSSVFSSPASSASTTTSFGSQSNNNNNYNNHCAGANQPHQYKRPVQQQRPAVRLTRSFSSITLDKQQQQQQQQQRQRTTNNRNNQAHRRQADAQSIASTASDFTAGHSKQTPSRAKSHCDFTNISEIVDVLTRRMDDIYAQNKRLLADLTKSNGVNRPASRCGAPMNCSSNSSVANYDPDELTCIRCHHCKAECFEGANYCHKCGCKLLQPRQSAATPDSGSEVQARGKTSDCDNEDRDDDGGCGGAAS